MRGSLPLFLGLVLAFLPARGVFAQSDLPAGVSSKTTLAASDEAAVASWAREHWARIDASDPEAARDARRRLVAPLLEPATTASFRLSMERALIEHLQSAMGGSDVFRGVNAALLSGWIATDRSLRLLGGAAHGENLAIRFAAVSGLGNAFRAAGLGSAAFEPQTGQEAVETLAAILERADDRRMLDAVTKALIEAMSVPEASIPGFGATAGERLTKAIGQRLNTLPIDGQLDTRITPLLRAMAEVRAAVTQRRRDISTGWRDAVMELYGRAGALGFRYIRAERAGTLGEAGTSGTRQSVENVLRVAGTMPALLRIDAAVQTQLSGLDLAQSFAQASQDRGTSYQNGVNGLIRLLGTSFSLPADLFNIN